MTKLSNFSQVAYDAFCKGFELAEKGDVEGAIEAYLIAAKLGATDAQNNLATLLDDHLKPAKPEEAIYWYKRALRAGDPAAAWNLAMHYSGRGEKRWYKYWLGVAEKMDDSDAPKELRSGKWWRKRNLLISRHNV